MPAMIAVRPSANPLDKEGARLVVRNPDRAMRPLRDEGEQVPLSGYWRRRIEQGDVKPISDEDWIKAEADRTAAAEKAEKQAVEAEKQAAEANRKPTIVKPGA